MQIQKKLSGICSHQMVHSYDFVHPKKGHVIHLKHRHCHRRQAFIVSCSRRGMKGQALKNCVFDLCAGAPRKLTFKIGREIKKQKKVIIKKVIRKILPMPRFAGRHCRYVFRGFRWVRVCRKHHHHHKRHHHHRRHHRHHHFRFGFLRHLHHHRRHHHHHKRHHHLKRFGRFGFFKTSSSSSSSSS